MDVNFEYYKIFYYVAKYNNFTRAARVLGNSQPNVTRAMNCLEQQLHCTLLVRTNRGVFLTTEGEKLYTHVAAAMEQLFTAEEELAECVGLSHGSIAIGASETALNLFLLDKLKEFHNTYPGIRLKIYNHSTPQAVEAVRRGTVDFAVVSTPVKADAPLHMTMLHPYLPILIFESNSIYVHSAAGGASSASIRPSSSFSQSSRRRDRKSTRLNSSHT